jgi:hypothetical protein
MGIPADLQSDVNVLIDRHFAKPGTEQVDDILGGYIDGPTADGTRFIALCLDFEVGKKDLRLLHVVNLQNRIVPLGRDSQCPMDVFGFASNTTNPNFSHEQNRELAIDRLLETVNELTVRNSVPGTLVTFRFGDSGELGDAGDEFEDERMSMVVVTLNGATPPPPLPL